MVHCAPYDHKYIAKSFLTAYILYTHSEIAGCKNQMNESSRARRWQQFIAGYGYEFTDSGKLAQWEES